MSRYESNQREPEYATLIRIAEFFGVSNRLFA
ncbi:helix-turn-helix domain-containing protein [Hydrogenispora ethanolica]|nr:helix-turn-helix transcriptional regulator [Hydrogenispora ethanolica]